MAKKLRGLTGRAPGARRGRQATSANNARGQKHERVAQFLDKLLDPRDPSDARDTDLSPENLPMEVDLTVQSDNPIHYEIQTPF
jgi:hypothetical protein